MHCFWVHCTIIRSAEIRAQLKIARIASHRRIWRLCHQKTILAWLLCWHHHHLRSSSVVISSRCAKLIVCVWLGGGDWARTKRCQSEANQVDRATPYIPPPHQLLYSHHPQCKSGAHEIVIVCRFDDSYMRLSIYSILLWGGCLCGSTALLRAIPVWIYRAEILYIFIALCPLYKRAMRWLRVRCNLGDSCETILFADL